MAPAVNADVMLPHHTLSTFSLLYFFRRGVRDGHTKVHLPHTAMITDESLSVCLNPIKDGSIVCSCHLLVLLVLSVRL